jgi:predicted nuclease of predicted toxin-antitoxin system
LADVHISPKTVESLRRAGYQISRTTDHLSPKAADHEIIAFAESQGAVIITQDLDFSALIAESGKAFPSVISLRLVDASPHHVTQILLRLLPTVEKELKRGSIISVDDETMRIRSLPI